MMTKVLVEPLIQAAIRFRLVSLGGLVSGGIAWVAYFRIGESLSSRVGPVAFMVFFALIGASLQASLQNITQRLTNFIRYYFKLLEITLVFKYWLTDDKNHREFVYAVSRERFLTRNTAK